VAARFPHGHCAGCRQPGLHVATISQNGAPTGRIVPSKIEIEFSWNWSDRSLDRIELSGVFFPATGHRPLRRLPDSRSIRLAQLGRMSS
jgi:hypothetical protein